jgi:N-acetylglucosaminyl-diphospho-decaprenol L-rhamnosyltransferase
VVDVASEIVVVDNASTDGSAGLVRRNFPEVKLIEMDRNRGFGTAANAGIGATTGRWTLLLNPDAWPLDGALERLLEFGDAEPLLGVAAPLLVDMDERPQRSVFKYPRSALELGLWAALPHGSSAAYRAWRRAHSPLRLGSNNPASIREPEFPMGAALLLRREALAQVGGFDESFFMFAEDADLCVRLRAAGWSVAQYPAAHVVHVGGGSTRLDPERMHQELLRAWLRFLAKHRDLREAERARLFLARILRVRGRVRSAPASFASASAEELQRASR